MNIIDAARKYVGVHESTPAHWALIDKYNQIVSAKHGTYRMTYGDPWCAAFVSLCAAEAGLTSFPFSAACQPMKEWATKNGRWSSTPNVGGLVLFDWDGDGIADHVGIVETVSGQNIGTIEGNTSDQCARRTYTTSGRGVMGFISLNTTTTEIPKTGQIITIAPKPSNVTPPIVRMGSTGHWVSAMQHMLIAHGYNCGYCGADGEYGSGTRTALVAFQKAKGLTPDGECGPNTWRKLVGA